MNGSSWSLTFGCFWSGRMKHYLNNNDYDKLVLNHLTVTVGKKILLTTTKIIAKNSKIKRE